MGPAEYPNGHAIGCAGCDYAADAQSDRPSPRGGGPADVINVTLPPARVLAVTRARELIAAAEDLRTGRQLAAWVGRAVVVLEELTRDA